MAKTRTVAKKQKKRPTHIWVVTETPFRSPWKPKETIGVDPVKVPFDSLCKCYLSDKSLNEVSKPKPSTNN